MKKLTREITIELIDKAGRRDEFKAGWGRSIEEYLDEYAYKAPQIWECVLADLDIEYELSFDTDYTDFPMCPYCGEKDLDWSDGLSFEVNDGSKWEGECGLCGRSYDISASVSIDFSTSKKDQPEPEPETEAEIPKPEKAITIPLDEFLAEAEKRFGKDRKKWKFVCPQCKTQQSFDDFKKFTKLANEEIEGYLGFSCIGRYTEKKVGCDWSLGGLFQLHEVEVVDGEGKRHPRFKLAEVS